MKKWFLIALASLACSILHASFPERVDMIAGRVLLENKQGYFVLADGTCWKVMGFDKRWRTPSEWWNDVQLIPENYETLPSEWVLGTQIEAYNKYENLLVDEANASNQEDLKQCTHLLVNTRTGQVLFAIALHTADCVVQVYNDAHKQGYNEGYQKGKKQGNAEGYDKGKTEGYSQGKTEGHNQGKVEGYNQGKAEGYSQGYNQGYFKGFQDGTRR